MKKGTWERNPSKYGGGGELYRVGKIILASVFWEGGSRDAVDHKPWAVGLELPSIKRLDVRYATIDEAKARAEHAVETWFKWVSP